MKTIVAATLALCFSASLFAGEPPYKAVPGASPVFAKMRKAKADNAIEIELEMLISEYKHFKKDPDAIKPRRVLLNSTGRREMHFQTIPLKELIVYDAQWNEIASQELANRVKSGPVSVIVVERQPLVGEWDYSPRFDSFFLQSLREDTLIVITPQLNRHLTVPVAEF
jgi:hypothetical protein